MNSVFQKRADMRRSFAVTPPSMAPCDSVLPLLVALRGTHSVTFETLIHRVDEPSHERMSAFLLDLANRFSARVFSLREIELLDKRQHCTPSHDHGRSIDL